MRKYGNDITVAVGEERILAIPTILQEVNTTSTIIMDDAYQHRYVIRDLDILLTTYGKPFYKDFLLPSGRLREPRRDSRRADIIVVTKCPENITQGAMDEVKSAIWQYSGSNKQVFFTQVKYSKAVNGEFVYLSSEDKILGFAGIAGSADFESHLHSKYNLKEFKSFGDHHHFSETDIKNLVGESTKLGARLVTTEKDWVRLPKHIQNDVYFVPIEVEFVEDGKTFDSLVLDAVASKINP
jgi:tetraacyldisaccharide 4'-kinase